MNIQSMTPIDRLVYWITERESIRQKKEAGEPKPWTDDPILQQFKFCNVFREDDKVTKWIAKHWREPHRGDPTLGFAMCVARWFNWPDTLQEIGYPDPWNPKRVLKIIQGRAARGEKIWSAAYFITTHKKPVPKPLFVVYHTLDKAWKSSKDRIVPKKGQKLVEYANVITSLEEFGGFMAGQIVADLKFVEPLKSASDWWTWAMSGPGSRRGLNRLLGMPVKSHIQWKEPLWLEHVQKLRLELNKRFEGQGLVFSAQDTQSCLCELDKYDRTLFGEGTPRQLYRGVSDAS